MKNKLRFTIKLLALGASCVLTISLPFIFILSCSNTQKEKVKNIYVKKKYDNNFVGSIDKKNWWNIGQHYIAQQWELEKGVEILNKMKDSDDFFNKDMRKRFNIKSNQEFIFVIYENKV